MENMSNIEYLNGLEDTSSDSDYDIENFNSKDIIGMLYNPPNTKRTYSSTWNEWKNSQLFYSNRGSGWIPNINLNSYKNKLKDYYKEIQKHHCTISTDEPKIINSILIQGAHNAKWYVRDVKIDKYYSGNQFFIAKMPENTIAKYVRLTPLMSNGKWASLRMGLDITNPSISSTSKITTLNLHNLCLINPDTQNKLCLSVS